MVIKDLTAAPASNGGMFFAYPVGDKAAFKKPQMGEVIPRWNGDGVFTGREDKPGESSKRA